MNNKLLKFLFYILLIPFIFIQNSLAVQDVIDPPDDIKNKKLVSGISFDDVFAKAKDHAYDLKLANLETQIAKTGIMGARSEYFPKLGFMMGTEYTKNYRDVRDTTVMSIGEAFINPYTRYQSVLGITLSYNVFDFGVRKGNLDRAKEDVTSKKLKEEKALQELELTLIDTYTKVLLAKKQLDLNNQIHALNQNNLEMFKRLDKAKQISKTDLNDRTFKLEKSKKTLSELKQMMSESLSWLGFYTGEEYDVDNLKIKDFPFESFNPMEVKDYTKTVTWKYYDSEIKKKQLELKVVKRTNLPKVSAYSRYYLYGSDFSSYPDVYSDLGPSNFSVGGTLSMPVFDGLKNYSDIKRTTLELQQVMVERDKAVGEWMTRVGSMRNNLIYLKEQNDSAEKMVSELKDKNNSKKRLKESKLISAIEVNDAKIELLEAEIEKIKTSVTYDAMIKGIKTLTEY